MASAFENEVIETDSGIILGEAEMEELIFAEMRKMQGNRQRAKSTMICKALRKTHGLNENVVRMSLNYMLKTGKIKDTKHAGRESLKIKETSVMDEVEIASEIEMQDMEENLNSGNVSRNGGRSAEDRDQVKEKARKISNDEERIIELRSELTERADRAEQEKKLLARSDEGETVDHESLSNFSESDESEGTDSEEEMLDNVESKALETNRTENRLDEIERKLEEIETRLMEKDKEQNDGKRKIDGMRVIDEKFVELMVKAEKLEKENKSLKDENCGLKIKILDLEKVIEKNGNKPGIEPFSQASILKPQQVPKSHSPWEFAREQQIFSTTTNDAKKDFPINFNGLSQNIQTMRQQEKGPNVSSTARELYGYGEESSQEARLRSKGIWEIPKVTARSIQFCKETIPIKITNRFNLLEENPAWGAEREIPCEFSHANDEVPTQGGEESNPRGISQMPKPTEKSLEKKTATNEYNPFAETTLWGTERSERNVVPGEHSYSEAVKRRRNENNEIRHTQARSTSWENQPTERTKKPSISIVGDSMLRNVRKQAFNRQIRHFSSYVKTFPGATVEHMKSYLEPTISMQPDGIIILCGTNNLRKEAPHETANKIIKLAVETKRRVKNVAVSAIIRRADSEELEWKRKQVNQLVEQGLETSEISFIKHDNIQNGHLDNWGLHLNTSGSNILTGNFIDFLKGV